MLSVPVPGAKPRNWGMDPHVFIEGGLSPCALPVPPALRVTRGEVWVPPGAGRAGTQRVQSGCLSVAGKRASSKCLSVF